MPGTEMHLNSKAAAEKAAAALGQLRAVGTIGKRNRRLNQEALSLAREIQEIDSKPAHWIARDAIRELESEKVQQRLAA